jgi:hypothetical protein
LAQKQVCASAIRSSFSASPGDGRRSPTSNHLVGSAGERAASENGLNSASDTWGHRSNLRKYVDSWDVPGAGDLYHRFTASLVGISCSLV